MTTEDTRVDTTIYQELVAERDALQLRVKALEGELDQERTQNKFLHARLSDLRETLANTQQEVTEWSESVKQVTQQRSDALSELARVNSELTEAHAQIRRLQDMLPTVEHHVETVRQTTTETETVHQLTCSKPDCVFLVFLHTNPHDNAQDIIDAIVEAHEWKENSEDG